jgi:CubicO group peptidase (beta-lactamase class C family)
MTIKSYLILLFSITILLSCDDFAFYKSKLKQKDNQKNSYFPSFPEPDKRYLKKKKKIVKRFFNKELGDKNFNGQFIVAKNGKIFFEEYHGYSNYHSKTKITANSPLHLASVSKVATSIAILRLFDDKKLYLDEDIRNYLPDIPYKGISIRMLLNHRSGIPYYGYFTYGIWPLNKTLTNKDVMLLIKKHKFPLNFKSNHHFAYCNTNFALLALIIEKITEKRFPDAMKDLVFDPLEMKNSFILEYDQNRDSISQSYNPGMSKYPFDYLDAVYGDKNMYSTARDILNMDRATYCDSFLSVSARKEMFKGYSYENKGSKNYGLGIRMVEEKNKTPYFYHTGWWHGNTTCYATLRQDTVCIIALSNVFDRRVYRINLLSPHFGNYPFQIEEE